GEEVAPPRQAVVTYSKAESLLEEFYIRLPLRLRFACDYLVLQGRREIHATALALGHNCHQPRTHTPGLALATDVGELHWRARHQADGAPPIDGFLNTRRAAAADDEIVPVAVRTDHRLDPYLLPLVCA